MVLPRDLRYIVKRPVELLRRVVERRSLGIKEEPVLKIYIPEAMDRTAEAAGLREYGGKVSGKIEWSPTWNIYRAKVSSPEIGTPFGLGSGSVVVEPTRARALYLIPYPVKPHYSASAYLDTANRIRVEGHQKLSRLLQNLILEAYTRRETMRAVPLSITVQPVSFTRKEDSVEVYLRADKGKERGLLVSIALEPRATDEELENQTKKIIERFVQQLEKYLD